MMATRLAVCSGEQSEVTRPAIATELILGQNIKNQQYELRVHYIVLFCVLIADRCHYEDHACEAFAASQNAYE